MSRRNGVPSRVRIVEPQGAEEGGRTRCRRCGVMLPRGADRPFCLDDSPYVQRLLVELDRQADAGDGSIAAA
jgi:hypothetical protein